MPTKKTCDTLVEDIYAMLNSVIDGSSKELGEGVLATLGAEVASALQRSLQARTKARPPKTLYMSEYARPCTRQLWYDLKGYDREKLKPENLIKFLYGDILEALVLALAEASGHEVTDEQASMELDIGRGWKIRGRIDARIDGELVDVKSTTSFGMKKFKEHKLQGDDPFGYIGQLFGYSYVDHLANGGTEEDKEGRKASFIAIDKGLGHLVRDEYKFKEFPNLQKDFDKLIDKLEATSPPERSYNPVPHNKSGNEKLGVSCSYCAFKKECWKDSNDGKGLRTFLYSTGPIFLTTVKREPNGIPEV